MQRAFTLIELLVVITIIVVLLAMLAPALDRAMYEAELVQCAGNLKVWGSISIDFAQDHQRRLPMAFGPFQTAAQAQGDDGRGARVLDRISDETSLEKDGRWKSYGTPWDTWLRYGMSNRLAVCPIWQGSGTGPATSYYYDDPNNPAPWRVSDTTGGTAPGVNTGWGAQVFIGYQYIGGTDTTKPSGPNGVNDFAWNSRPPASRLTNANASSVLVSDLLYMNRGWANPPNNYRAVGHPASHSPVQPQSMSITFGDTHVALERETFFEQPQIFGNTGLPAPHQYSYRGGDSFYWWGK
jgi:prepilin-type N-terminal cleavage/methylation domain-containing protein